ANVAKPPLLVIKAQWLDRFPSLHQALFKAAGELPIRIIDANLSRTEMYSLLSICDAYVSLHRSEGFGLGMAEAMALGKPVIGTNWSGNTDFMRPDNSYPVPYQLVEISAQHHRFQESHKVLYIPGSNEWAEPSIEAAVEIMRQVFENPREA